MASPRGSTFTRLQRLRHGSDFVRVYARRCSVSDSLVRLCACENDAGRTRLGLSVSRKVGGAVVRNRWKRLLREAFRHVAGQLPAGIDLVAIPQPGATPELGPLTLSLRQLASRVAARLERGSA